ncbi:MAG: class I SAM-dependent methyltransferase [Acidobacteriaceae bacterium]|nr:class I SAM-dependent methyltransferase [Acidobacteriaceae bacterium]
MTAAQIADYGYSDAEAPWADAYLWPAVERLLHPAASVGGRAFDLGCGNGALTARLAGYGFETIGVDPSESGIVAARKAYPSLTFEVGSSDDPLAKRFGQFELVISLEVIEHCIHPWYFGQTVFGLTKPSGTAIISTPYHGYAKNLALSLANRWDKHLDPFWVGGHIKLFSPSTLTHLLKAVGFSSVSIHRIGRIPPLAKSMIAVAKR